MGTWGSSLYSNDCACDVRDTYIELLQEQLSNQEAYKQTVDKLKEYLGSEEEPLFWFALADTQWRYGKLMPEVRDRALDWIEKDGGLSFWTDDGKSGDGWRKTLAKLRVRLESPQPKEKTLKKVLTNPWNVGDVYAYRFHSEQSKESGLYGKYIVFHKIADETWQSHKTYSRIQIYSKVFTQLPTLEDAIIAEILPLDFPNLFSPHEYDQWHLNMNAVMIVLGCRDYPKKYFTYIGNRNDTRNMPRYNHSTSLGYWKNMEEPWLCPLCVEWREFEYELQGDTAHIRKRAVK